MPGPVRVTVIVACPGAQEYSEWFPPQFEDPDFYPGGYDDLGTHSDRQDPPSVVATAESEPQVVQLPKPMEDEGGFNYRFTQMVRQHDPPIWIGTNVFVNDLVNLSHNSQNQDYALKAKVEGDPIWGGASMSEFFDPGVLLSADWQWPTLDEGGGYIPPSEDTPTQWWHDFGVPVGQSFPSPIIVHFDIYWDGPDLEDPPPTPDPWPPPDPTPEPCAPTKWPYDGRLDDGEPDSGTYAPEDRVVGRERKDAARYGTSPLHFP